MGSHSTKDTSTEDSSGETRSETDPNRREIASRALRDLVGGGVYTLPEELQMFLEGDSNRLTEFVSLSVAREEIQRARGAAPEQVDRTYSGYQRALDRIEDEMETLAGEIISERDISLDVFVGTVIEADNTVTLDNGYIQQQYDVGGSDHSLRLGEKVCATRRETGVRFSTEF